MGIMTLNVVSENGFCANVTTLQHIIREDGDHSDSSSTRKKKLRKKRSQLGENSSKNFPGRGSTSGFKPTSNAGKNTTETIKAKARAYAKQVGNFLAQHKGKIAATTVAALLYADYAGYIGKEGFDMHEVAWSYLANGWAYLRGNENSCNVEQTPLTTVLRDQGLSCADQQDVVSVTRYFKNGGAATDGCNGCLKPGGILISGPPGTGKTAVAKIVAKTAGCDSLIEAGPADLATPEKIQSFFSSLRSVANQPGAKCQAVLLDEYNNVAELGKATLEPLLIETERAAAGGNDNILFMAATNFPEKIAPSAQRSGRFDFHLRTLLPTAETRAKILSSLSSKAKQVIPSSVIAKAGELTSGCSFADLANIARCSALRELASKTSDIGSTFMSCVSQVVKKVHGS